MTAAPRQREINAPRFLRPTLALWSHFVPGELIPCATLQELAIEFGVEVVEIAVDECGRSGEMSIERLRVILDRLGRELRRETRRSR